MYIIYEDDLCDFFKVFPVQPLQHGNNVVHIGILAIHNHVDLLSCLNELIDIRLDFRTDIRYLAQIGRAHV